MALPPIRNEFAGLGDVYGSIAGIAQDFSEPFLKFQMLPFLCIQVGIAGFGKNAFLGIEVFTGEFCDFIQQFMKSRNTLRTSQFSAQGKPLADGEQSPVLFIQNRMSDTASRTPFLWGRHFSCLSWSISLLYTVRLSDSIPLGETLGKERLPVFSD